MGTVTTRFIYSTVEEALAYSSYYSDLLNSYNNRFISKISVGDNEYELEFKIYESDSRGQNSSGNSEGTRYLSEPSSEDGQDPI